MKVAVVSAFVLRVRLVDAVGFVYEFYIASQEVELITELFVGF